MLRSGNHKTGGGGLRMDYVPSELYWLPASDSESHSLRYDQVLGCAAVGQNALLLDTLHCQKAP